jgi:hypothetical protein
MGLVSTHLSSRYIYIYFVLHCSNIIKIIYRVGGAFALGDYYSCVDYKVEGGLDVQTGNITPEFKGGDVHNPDKNQCLFFNANDVGICVNEPCNNGNMPGKQNGAPKGFDSAGPASKTIVSSANQDVTSFLDTNSNANTQPTTSELPESSGSDRNATTESFDSFSLVQDDLLISYAQTTTGQTFEGVFNITNGGVNASVWSIQLNLPEAAEINRIINAKYVKKSPGMFQINALSPVEPNSEQQVGVQGTL